MDNKLVPMDHDFVSFDMNELCRNSIELIQYARHIAAKQVDQVQLMPFYSLGRWIVEEQQQGESRAKYGQHVIRNLSEALTKEFGRGFSVDTLENARRFYLTYGDRISEPVFRKFAIEKNRTGGSEFCRVSVSSLLDALSDPDADPR